MHELLRHGMAKQPADRPQHALAFLDDLERVAGTAYGPDWEERGLGELARRAALLAALWPFPDRAGGATSLASTTIGGATSDRSAGFRRGRKWTALAGGALVAALLIGGAGYRYAAADEPGHRGRPGNPCRRPGAGRSRLDPPAGLGDPGRHGDADRDDQPDGPGRHAESVPVRLPLLQYEGHADPVDQHLPDGSARRHRPDGRHGQREPVGAGGGAAAAYGARTSTIAVTVTDNTSGPAALKVSFRYTLGGTASTVAMTSVGRNVFQGTLGPLPMQKSATRIAISVVAVDAAGNSGQSASPAYVSLANTCTPG